MGGLSPEATNHLLNTCWRNLMITPWVIYLVAFFQKLHNQYLALKGNGVEKSTIVNGQLLTTEVVLLRVSLWCQTLVFCMVPQNGSILLHWVRNSSKHFEDFKAFLFELVWPCWSRLLFLPYRRVGGRRRFAIHLRTAVQVALDCTPVMCV